MCNTNKQMLSCQNNTKKDNEYYTTYEHACAELDNYATQFAGKKVYCPCDDPRWSNIFRYFVENYKKLGIPYVYCSFYEDSTVENTDFGALSSCCWAIGGDTRPKCVYAENWKCSSDEEVDLITDTMLEQDWNIPEGTRIGVATKFGHYKNKTLSGTNKKFHTRKGSFNSEEAMELAKDCDIIVTNPPFTMFEEDINGNQVKIGWGKFLEWCINTGKQFIVLGKNDVMGHHYPFLQMMRGKVRCGYICNSSKYKFLRPDGSFGGPATTWYTNMEVAVNNECYYSGKKMKDIKDLVYFDEPYNHPGSFNTEKVLNLKAYTDLPDDYYGLFAVPVTAIHHFSRNFFDYVDCNHFNSMCINGKQCGARVLLRRKQLDNVHEIEKEAVVKTLDIVAPKQENGRGYVYVFEDEHDHIKIGITNRPAQERLDECQTGNADLLTIACISCPSRDYEIVEKKIHEACAKWHKRGEWFDARAFKTAVKMITEMTAPSKQDVKRFRDI